MNIRAKPLGNHLESVAVRQCLVGPASGSRRIEPGCRFPLSEPHPTCYWLGEVGFGEEDLAHAAIVGHVGGIKGCRGDPVETYGRLPIRSDGCRFCR